MGGRSTLNSILCAEPVWVRDRSLWFRRRRRRPGRRANTTRGAVWAP